MIQFLKSYIVFVILSLSWVWGDCDEGEVELWDECYNIEETTFLQLSWNGLTGEISPEIGNLTNLTKLWLYSNELTGEIPPEIGNLINLDGIDLHSNQFSGEIPSTVGNLTNLTYLNFSLNELTGEIPESICNLTIDFSFYNFHIEDNQFCPPYPSCIEDYVGYQDTSNCGQNNIEIVYQSDWNLVGLPVEVENPYYLTLFPDAIENTLFSFDDAYTPDSIMREGEGYWLRFESAGNTTITGNSINELTISLNEGWNLISGISTPLNITDIQDTDGIIISGTIYGFTSGGYSNTENIEPGKGYWIRANNSGNIILISP